MALNLVNYQEQAREAVKGFWVARKEAEKKQKESGKVDAGSRGAVTGGKNMDGFVPLLSSLVAANGLVHADVHENKGSLILPGYFRATKQWDVLVMQGERLVAALELKSIVGSFGKNCNNRIEEAIGTAECFRTAIREGALGGQPRPFLGWLMVIEDHPESRRPIRIDEPHFPAFPDFKGASYIGRMDLLCQRLAREQLYTAAALISSPASAIDTGEYSEISTLTSLQTFVTAFAGHIATEAARVQSHPTQLF